MSFCGLVNCTECESQHWVKSLFLFSSCATYTGRLPTVMQLGGFTSIRKKQIYWLLFKCCNILKQSSVCSWSGADARSDGIIVFSAPLCEAACQKQQDNKWDVCKFTEEEWFLFFFQFAAVKAFFYHCAELVPGVYQTAMRCEVQRRLVPPAQHRKVTSCFLSCSV